MTMHSNGLTKLSEECGELIQICMKKSAFMDFEIHPDGNNMRQKLSEEIADVLAACEFVMQTFELNKSFINVRKSVKLCAFNGWHDDKNV